MVELYRDFQFADLNEELLARVLRERPELLTDFDWVVLFHRTGDRAWLDRVKNYEKALMAAAEIGSVAAAQWAYDMGARNVEWAMQEAAERGHTEVEAWLRARLEEARLHG